jgi:uncharacterized protein (TIGR04255 family)
VLFFPLLSLFRPFPLKYPIKVYQTFVSYNTNAAIFSIIEDAIEWCLFASLYYWNKGRPQLLITKLTKSVVNVNGSKIQREDDLGYRKPLIVELAAQLYLAPGVLPEAKYFDIVPRWTKSNLEKIEISKTMATPLFGLPVPFVPVSQVRCSSSDRGRVAQLLPDTVVANVVVNENSPYPGWESARDFFSSVFQNTQVAITDFKVLSVCLIMIDRLVLNEGEYRLGDFLKCDGEILPKAFADCKESCDIIFGKGTISGEGQNQQLKLSAKKNPADDTCQIVINSVFHKNLDNTKSYLQLVEELHKEAVVSFKKLVTTKTIEKMGGEE